MNFDTFTPEILIRQCLTFEMDVLTSWKFIAVQFYVPSILRPTKIESKNLNETDRLERPLSKFQKHIFPKFRFCLSYIVEKMH